MALTNETRTNASAALLSNLPPSQISKKDDDELIKKTLPNDDAILSDSEEDYKFTRESVKKLIETSNVALEALSELANDSEHPRAFEVLAGLLKTTADMNSQLLTIHKDRKKMHTKPDTARTYQGENQTITNNAIFVGTTSDLQKYLDNRESKTIEV